MSKATIDIKKINFILSLIIILLISVIFYFFYKIFHTYINNLISLILPFIVGGCIAYLLNPICDYLERKTHLPRVLLSILIIGFLLFILILFILLVIPLLINEASSFKKSIPKLISSSKIWIDSITSKNYGQLDIIFDNIQKYLTKTSDTFNSEQFITKFGNFLLGTLNGLTGFVMNTIFIIMTLIYVMTDYHKFSKKIRILLPKKYSTDILYLLNEYDKIIQIYIKGLFTSAIFVALFSTLGFKMLNLDYAILLGVFCGLFNVIPYIGPYLGAIPAIIVGLGQDPKLLIGVIVVVIIVQQIDGNILTPKIQGKGLDLHPLSILITIAIFGNLFGIVAMVISVPILAMFKTTFIFVKNKMHP